jgi:hypothetical protein
LNKHSLEKEKASIKVNDGGVKVSCKSKALCVDHPSTGGAGGGSY